MQIRMNNLRIHLFPPFLPCSRQLSISPALLIPTRLSRKISASKPLQTETLASNLDKLSYKSSLFNRFVHGPQCCRTYIQTHNYSDSHGNTALDLLLPGEFIQLLEKERIDRCFITNFDGELEYSHEILKDVLPLDALKANGFEHDAIFFEIGHRTKCLLSVFLWKVHRGQAVSSFS